MSITPLSCLKYRPHFAAVQRILTTSDAGSDSFLRQKASPVAENELQTPRIQQVIQDLTETLLASEHAYGLAANQIGEMVRIFVYRTGLKVGPGSMQDVRVVINPEIQTASENKKGREGCASIPNRFFNVKRPQKVSIFYWLPSGRKTMVHFQDPVDKPRARFARCFQHELDHLDGILLDRKTGSEEITVINPS